MTVSSKIRAMKSSTSSPICCIAEGLTADGAAPDDDDACACANAIYNAFSTVFTAWYEDKTLAFLQEDALAAADRRAISGAWRCSPTAPARRCSMPRYGTRCRP